MGFRLELGVSGFRMDVVPFLIERTARVEVGARNGQTLVDVFDDRHSRADASGAHRIAMKPYGYRWFRVGAADNALDRSAL